MDAPTAPPAPPPPPPVAAPARPAARPGQLTPGWRIITLVTWVLVFVAWSGAWAVSRQLGLGTWWLGPISAPQPILVMILPFLPPAAMVVLTLNNVIRLPWYGLAASALGALIAAFDVNEVRRLGFVELAIAVASALVSIASTSGMYRPVPGA